MNRSNNPFIRKGRSLPDDVRSEIVDKWLDGNGPTAIGRQTNIPKSTVVNIVNKFVERGDHKHRSGGCSTRTTRTDDVVLYTEYCKQQQPSITANEIQKKLVENDVCLAQNVPSQASISRIVQDDLGYSYKRIVPVARESLTEANEQKLMDYLAVCSNLDPTSMHFFDECSVIKTTGNRRYGHSAIGSIAVEIQRYASNANFTVNVLHGIFGIDHVNILNGPSNGLELLNFFEESLEEEDIFGNSLLKPGDTIIMDNCGFHHARHIEPALVDMLAGVGCNLIFQPPYHPVYNTCEYCFGVLKKWLRKNTKLSEDNTRVAIYDGLSRITPEMSRNFFKHCGYIV